MERDGSDADKRLLSSGKGFILGAAVLVAYELVDWYFDFNRSSGIGFSVGIMMLLIGLVMIIRAKRGSTRR